MSNAFDGFDPQKKIKELIQENSRLTADYERAIQYLEAEIAALRAALEAVEFANISYTPEYDIATRRCLWCKKTLEADHSPDCQRQAALGLKR